MRDSHGHYGHRVSLEDIALNHLLTASIILAKVSRTYAITWDQLIRGGGRPARGPQRISTARACATWLIRRHLDWPYPLMAKLIFRCDHSTLVERVRRIDPRTLKICRRIEKELDLNARIP